MKNISEDAKQVGKADDVLAKKRPSLNPLEERFIEKSKEASKLAFDGEKDKALTMFEAFALNGSRPLPNTIVYNGFDYASPPDYEHEPDGSLFYPISSAGADHFGNFHLGLGIGSPLVNVGVNVARPPDFDIGDPSDFYRHSVSAKIGHNFPINNSGTENHIVRSQVRIPKGVMDRLQFEVGKKPFSHPIFKDIFYAGYLIGSLNMRVYIDGVYVKTARNTFLEWYKTTTKDLGYRIPGINNVPDTILLKTDVDVPNGSILRVEVEVEIIVGNTSFAPNGETIRPSNMYIGVQYFEPEFLLNDSFDKVRYVFNEFGESPNSTRNIKLDFIQVIEAASELKINTNDIIDEMQSN